MNEIQKNEQCHVLRVGRGPGFASDAGDSDAWFRESFKNGNKTTGNLSAFPVTVDQQV